MLTLMTAAFAAAQAHQPAQAANVHPQHAQMQMPSGQVAPHQSHQAPQHQGKMEGGCPCCRNMAQDHQGQAPAARPSGHSHR